MTPPPFTWIEQAIRISSVTDQSNEEMVRFLAPLCEKAGLKVEEVSVAENGQVFKNLLAYSHNLTSPNLIAFNTHLDTVSPGRASDWTKTQGDPFKATKVRNRVYGLGTADVKLDFLCKLSAAQASKPWNKPIALVGTFGEERGLVGAKQLLSSKKIKPKFTLVGEPSNLELIYAHKGHLVITVEIPISSSSQPTFTMTWKGKAAHSSTPELGKNALRKGLDEILKRGSGIVSLNTGGDSNKVPDHCEAVLIREKNPTSHLIFSFLNELDELSRDLKRRHHPRFKPPRSTLSLNRAVTSGNSIFFTFDCRTLPDLNMEQLEKRIRLFLNKLNLKIADLTLDLPLKGNRESPLMKLASRSLKSCGVKVIKTTKASSTEAAIYQSFGSNAIVFGPGISVGNVHRPNEYNILSQLTVATEFYKRIMTN